MRGRGRRWARLWNIKDRVNTVAWSPDGTLMATASSDQTARVWDARTGQAVGAPLQHQDGVRSVAWSPDGTRVATASFDRTARVWDARTGQAVGAPLQHQGLVNAVAWSPDGTRVATASSDRTARVWDASAFEAIDALRLADLAESLGGLRVSEADAVEGADFAGRRARLESLLKIANEPGRANSTFSRFVNWLLADPWGRTITPFSTMLPDEYIRQMLALGPRGRLDAERAFPGHPLLK